MSLLLDVYDGDKTLVTEMNPKKLQGEFDRRLRAGQYPATLSGYRHSLKKFGAWFGDKKFADGLDCGRVEPRKKARFWTDREVERLRQAADRIDEDNKRRQNADPRWYRMVLELGLATGARVGELYAIRWENFSPRQPLVYIEEQLEPITQEEATYLKSHSARRSSPVLAEWAEFHRPGAEGRVLGGTSGNVRSTAFTKIKREAGLDERGVGFHSLRHSYARRLMEEHRATLDQVQAALGHSHIATTEKYYKHLSRDVMRDSLAALVSGPPATAQVPPVAPMPTPWQGIGALSGTKETSYGKFNEA